MASLDTDWTQKVEFPTGMWNINLLLCVQNAPGAHQDSYQVGTAGIFPGGGLKQRERESDT